MMEKRDLGELAILGGSPLSPHQVFVGTPNIGNRGRLMERINDLLDRRQLSNNGLYVEELERRTAALCGARHSVSVCNATIGLELLIRALGLTGEVIVPSMTFIATAHALEWHGLKPAFCDIDPATHNLDPAKVEALIGPQTSAILGVHLWGRPCPVDDLAAVAKRHDLRLIYDAAHAIGCSHGGRMIGSFGDAEVFSLHATKVLNAFEGGLITTNDDDLAARLRLMRNFGFAGYDNVIELGTNAKMSEASAAMGVTSLDSFEEFVASNSRNHRCYRSQLDGVPGIRLVAYDDGERCNYQYVVAEVDGDASPVSRDDLIQTLWAENILVRKYFSPGCHAMRPYKERYPMAVAGLRATAHLADRLLVLPTGSVVGEDLIRGICSVIRLAAENGDVLATRLRSLNRRTAAKAA